ncbi:hypothetical protein SAMN05444161_3527 [Rhizobiales bacterium GAS191]|nr:hypothetical protein SAMN05519103_00260 [Rhizobiales bacterium GAS113]SEC62137.1 hypothetical protein SAMN05444161_1491 [Rhizobiales bacterium GAS191]SDR06112.1 hypothetical protein SAMN05519103_00584 [Rhizobiales bacterium GAS113]SDR10916.1 hypothetical protein SAMN05519103_00777 [Rhizobiales bacterium GAS113]SDR57247.1 hypothetical protein SAMN05519103_05691 [Rhizobiales bacterium GAS113]
MTIPGFDRSDHPFVPTCPPAERRAPRTSPRRGRSAAQHRALARLTQPARRYARAQTGHYTRYRAGLPPRKLGLAKG